MTWSPKAAWHADYPRTRRLLDEALSVWGESCWWCGADNPNALDHVVPLSRLGGVDRDTAERMTWSVEYVRPCCKPCNSSRGNRKAPKRRPRQATVQRAEGW